MEHQPHVAMTAEQRTTFDRFYSSLVAFQASALYYVSLGYDNDDKAVRAAEMADHLLAFRHETFGDPCGEGEVPCSNGSCAPPGSCGPGADFSGSLGRNE